MEANNHQLIRRAVSQRHSLRASKRLMRSSSGTSPLARNLLRSLHEQKRAALAEQRARRWELYSVVNQQNLVPELLPRPDPEHEEETAEQDQVVPSMVPDITPEESSPMEHPLLYTGTSKYDLPSKSGKKKGLIKFRTVRKHVSQVVTRMFVRKADKHQLASSGGEFSDLKAFRRYPSTVL